VGICGSDLHNFSEGSVGDLPSQYPMVLGHEPTGTVVLAGAGVTGWTEGDKALLEPAIYCYHCEHCLRGRHNVCANLRFLSMPGDPGYFRDYVNLPARNLIPLPPRLGMKEATLFEPLAVVLHSMKWVQLSPGETVAVFGAGPIGLLTIAALRLSGARRIFAVEPVAHRRDLALAAGACAVIDPRASDPVRQMMNDTGKRGVDVSIDCATKENTINQCLQVTRNAGRVVITGIPSDAEPRFQFHVARRKELAIYNVRRSNHETELAVRMLVGHTALFAGMITHTRPLDDVEDAFLTLEHYTDGVGKVVIDLDSSSAP
jgi:L-iditol 2-dehydrogenase